MPYPISDLSELKRPDLKGRFSCLVCHKVFCHSSSLSRHRMLAHFKGYQCMLCKQGISCNETLRSHMLNTHHIMRVFMCRCCNWAFADKSTLHMHITSLERTGQPGNAFVLARGVAQEDEPCKNVLRGMLNSFVTPLSSPVKPGTPLPVDYGTLPSMKVEITSPVKPDTLASMMAKTATPKKAEAPTPNNTVANALPLASANPLGFFNHVMAQRHLFGAPPRMTQPSDMVAQWVMNNPFMNGANANMQPNHHVGLGVDGFHHPLPASDLEPAPKQRRIDTPPGHSASFNESTMSYAMDSAMVIDLTNSDVFPRKCKRKAKKPNHKSAVDGVNVLTATVPESPPFIFTDSETAMYRGGESVECHPSPTISDSNTSTNSEVSEIQLAVQEVKAQLACIATLNNNILQLCDQDLATPNVVKYYASQIRSLCQ